MVFAFKINQKNKHHLCEYLKLAFQLQKYIIFFTFIFKKNNTIHMVRVVFKKIKSNQMTYKPLNLMNLKSTKVVRSY